jgi:hypothetical protein
MGAEPRQLNHQHAGGGLMVEIKLPFWLGGDQFDHLITAAKSWWQQAQDWIYWPLEQTDPLTCTVGILDLIAFSRDIERFADEPLSLYRKRVKYALINAQDAGSKAGFIRIFERLGIGYLEIDERVDATDWDVILLYLSDSQLAENVDLLGHIIRKYGRTCRRYQLTVINPIELLVENYETGGQWDYDVAKQEIEPWLATASTEQVTVGNSWGLDVARL